VPLLRWPKEISPPPYGEPVSTCCRRLGAAGASLPTDRAIDGVNLLPFLDGTAASAQPHEALFWRSGYYQAVRVNSRS
jgi:hypothetical protein